MSNHVPPSRALRPHSLAACLAAVLGLTLSAVTAVAASSSGDGNQGGRNARPYPPGPSARVSRARDASNPMAPDAHIVTKCTDDLNNPDPGSLRAQVAGAASGETIDLSTLTCSTITLAGPIQIPQPLLYLRGPTDRTVTIDGDKGGAGIDRRVFVHTGIGLLGIYDLTITNGESVAGLVSNGGCIYAAGSVYLFKTTVSNCTLSETSNVTAKGGGIYAKGDLTMFDSTITGNTADTASGDAYGGGAFANGEFKAFYSTVSDNVAGVSNATNSGFGGGIYASQMATIVSSTISGNKSDFAGGVWLENGGKIDSSTISDNMAERGAGGLYGLADVTISNSTVAFNRQMAGTGYSGGIYFAGTLDLVSSIVADNARNGAQDDVEGTSPVTGSKDLITAAKLSVPFGTKTSCPKLQGLTNTGGLTKTHAPMASSEAIDNGDAQQPPLTDQRGLPRFQGIAPDIGSVERQPGEKDDRIWVGGFDGLCDE